MPVFHTKVPAGFSTPLEGKHGLKWPQKAMCDLNLRTPPTIHCLISCHFPFCSLQSIQTHVLEVPQTHSRFSSFNFHGLTFGKL